MEEIQYTHTLGLSNLSIECTQTRVLSVLRRLFDTLLENCGMMRLTVRWLGQASMEFHRILFIEFCSQKMLLKESPLIGQLAVQTNAQSRVQLIDFESGCRGEGMDERLTNRERVAPKAAHSIKLTR